jgi:hypothetical protein
MYSRQLKTALQERLSFYEGLMERLRQSIEAEDSERIEYYRGLEQETLRSLSNLEKCIAALSQHTLPAPDSSDEMSLDTRVAQARLRAIEAARANCTLLRTQLSQLKSRMTTVRAKSAPLSFVETNPSYLDIDI